MCAKFVMRTSSRTAPPIDYSFRDLSYFKDLDKVEARSGKRIRIRERKTEAQNREDIIRNKQSDGVIIRAKKQKKKESTVYRSQHDNEPQEKEEKVKEVIKMSKYFGHHLKLCSNGFKSGRGLRNAIHKIMEQPEELKILDLSFNRLHNLEEICEELSEFTELTVFYLHGNHFSDHRMLKHLKRFPRLRTLTLHGTPIDQFDNYRLHALAMVPTLKSIDFTTVTNRERENSRIYNQLLLRRGKKKKKKKRQFY